MTTLAQATAASMEIRLGGRTFRMSPLSDRDIAELDNWLQARVMRIARESLPQDAAEADRRLTMEVALSKAASLTWMGPEGARLMATLEGMAQLIWQGIKTNHPEVTSQEIRSLFLDPANLDEARAAFDRLNTPSSGAKKKRDLRRMDRKKRRRGR